MAISGSATLLGTYNTNGNPVRSAAYHSGINRMITATGHPQGLWIQDLTSGAMTEIDDFSGSIREAEGLAYDDVNDIFYLADDYNNRLRTITVTISSISIASTVSLSYSNVGAIAYGNGTLYGIDETTNKLVTINPTSGVATDVNSAAPSGFGINSSLIHDLAYHKASNRLFGIDHRGDQLVEFNLTDGTASAVDSSVTNYGLSGNKTLGTLAFGPDGTLYANDNSAGNVYTFGRIAANAPSWSTIPTQSVQELGSIILDLSNYATNIDTISFTDGYTPPSWIRLRGTTLNIRPSLASDPLVLADNSPYTIQLTGTRESTSANTTITLNITEAMAPIWANSPVIKEIKTSELLSLHLSDLHTMSPGAEYFEILTLPEGYNRYLGSTNLGWNLFLPDDIDVSTFDIIIRAHNRLGFADATFTFNVTKNILPIQRTDLPYLKTLTNENLFDNIPESFRLEGMAANSKRIYIKVSYTPPQGSITGHVIVTDLEFNRIPDEDIYVYGNVGVIIEGGKLYTGIGLVDNNLFITDTTDTSEYVLNPVITNALAKAEKPAEQFQVLISTAQEEPTYIRQFDFKGKIRSYNVKTGLEGLSFGLSAEYNFDNLYNISWLGDKFMVLASKTEMEETNTFDRLYFNFFDTQGNYLELLDYRIGLVNQKLDEYRLLTYHEYTFYAVIGNKEIRGYDQQGSRDVNKTFTPGDHITAINEMASNGQNLLILHDTNKLSIYGGDTDNTPEIESKKQLFGFETKVERFVLLRHFPTTGTIAIVNRDVSGLLEVNDRITNDRIETRGQFIPVYTLPDAEIGDYLIPYEDEPGYVDLPATRYRLSSITSTGFKKMQTFLIGE